MAKRQVSHHRVRRLRQVHARQDCHAPRAQLCFRTTNRGAAKRQAQHRLTRILAWCDQQILHHAHRGEQQHVLPGAGDATTRPPVQSQAVDRRALQLDASRVRPHHAGDQVEQRGLAGAVRADQSEDFAGVNRQVDVIGDDDAAECLAHAAEA
jgi:hypothetical protein